MTRSEPDDFVRPPVDALAQLLLQDALDDLSLVKRTRGSGKSVQVSDMQSPSVRRNAPALCLVSDSDLANKRYLEDLVSIAIASAERADSVLLKADATHTKTVRAICGLASVAVVGIAAAVVGVVGLPGGGVTDQKLVAVAGQIHSLDQQQQVANNKLDAVKSEVDDQRKAATSIQHASPPLQVDASDPQDQAQQRVITVPGGQPIIATPLSPLRDATYSEPWPGPDVTKQTASYSYQWPQAPDTAQSTSYSTLWPSPSHTEPAQQPSWTARHRRVQQPPQFLLVIQRNLRMLFR
jgi:hypothetical protein